jgi:multimeric flavodoxin WrbA
MKILLLNGSARNNGSTFTALSIIDNALDKSIFQPTVLNISDFNINYCLGCHCCEKTRKCIQCNDDISRIFEYFIQSDIICIASPSYWGYVTGQLKVFFDRSTPYCGTIDCNSAFPIGKKGIALSIRAGSSNSESIEIINSIGHYFSHLGIELVHSLSLESIRDKSDIEKKSVTNKLVSFSNKINSWGRHNG